MRDFEIIPFLLFMALALGIVIGWHAGTRSAGASDEYTATVFAIAANAEVENSAPTQTPTATPTHVPPTPTPEPTVETAHGDSVWPTDRALTRDEMRSLLYAAGFPQWTHATAKRIAWCESRFKPWATGAQSEMGIFQIHPRWHSDATYDVLGNARAAYRISNGGTNWSAWSCR